MFETKTYDDPVVLAPDIRRRWTFLETSSASAVLRSVCPAEWGDITDVLSSFALDPVHWLKKGGNRGDIAQQIDDLFSQRGWRETRVDLVTQGIMVSRGGEEIERLPEVHQEGYLVDNFKGRVALDVEWNAKDGNLDRDLSAYRAWHDAGVISAAVLITQDRISLKALAERLWSEYQQTLPTRRQNPKLPIDLTAMPDTAPRTMNLAHGMPVSLTPPSAPPMVPPSPRCAGRGTQGSLREIHVKYVHNDESGKGSLEGQAWRHGHVPAADRGRHACHVERKALLGCLKQICLGNLRAAPTRAHGGLGSLQ